MLESEKTGKSNKMDILRLTLMVFVILFIALFLCEVWFLPSLLLFGEDRNLDVKLTGQWGGRGKILSDDCEGWQLALRIQISSCGSVEGTIGRGKHTPWQNGASAELVGKISPRRERLPDHRKTHEEISQSGSGRAQNIRINVNLADKILKGSVLVDDVSTGKDGKPEGITAVDLFLEKVGK